jgi:hypothetical protein
MIYSTCTLSTLCVMILFLILMIKFCDIGNKLLGDFLKKEMHLFIKSKYRVFVLNPTQDNSLQQLGIQVIVPEPSVSLFFSWKSLEHIGLWTYTDCTTDGADFHCDHLLRGGENCARQPRKMWWMHVKICLFHVVVNQTCNNQYFADNHLINILGKHSKR